MRDETATSKRADGTRTENIASVIMMTRIAPTGEMGLHAVIAVYPVAANPPGDPGMMTTIEADGTIVPIAIGIMIGIVAATAMMIKTDGETAIEIMTETVVIGTETISTAVHPRPTHLDMTETETAIVTLGAAVATIETINYLNGKLGGCCISELALHERRLTTIRPLKSVTKIAIPWTIKVKSDQVVPQEILETKNPMST